MYTKELEAGWDPSLEMESVQNTPCQPMAMLDTNVLLPYRKDKVRERAFLSGGILEISALFIFCLFFQLVLLKVKQRVGKENGNCFLYKIWLQHVPPFIAPCMVVLCTHSKDVTTLCSLLGICKGKSDSRTKQIDYQVPENIAMNLSRYS